MTPDDANVRWIDHDGPLLGAVAAVLGCEPRLIVAVHDIGPHLLVAFTPGYPDDPELWIAQLERQPTDPDPETGEPVDHLVELRRARRPGAWEALREGLDEALGGAP